MRLTQFLTEQRVPVPAFADRIGVSQAALYRYIAGARTPRRDVMQRIVAETAGAVQPNDFFPDAVPSAPVAERAAA